ncbi:UbiA family prenyltransferase [Amycolatopsis magusensis]|uniref:4-hydroxybenzoate polyprenyltransferase/geranylgeranylglycerol-phosphate geranylgeranyltransferase n=1 Tax=Amycolatopsis magusensis TaxID=882444 RepID=A0ABS4Q271_9PSEU|nr:UbiA family prenyltransferase [Amycolatopsis magusensis]MBP2185790.1 4-hydroxybenzoate polyprenyltransferase/geranylgeranylglycerol-phosphate geranylgeranyltransferase [Amycolatopsis magusensis]
MTRLTTAGRWRPAAVAHMQTWRPYTLCYPALLGLAGAAAAGDAVAPAAALVPALGWLSGHYLGDYFDRGLDAIGKPHRPIPSGRLSAEAALYSGIACALASALLAVLVNWRILPVFVLAMLGIVGYSKVFKKRGASGNVVRGALSAVAVVIGAMLVVPSPTWSVVPVALGFLVHDTASNLVGTVRDVDGDRAGGYRSVPVRHGVRHAVRLAFGLYLVGVLFVTSGALTAFHGSAHLALTAVAAVAGVAAFAPLLRAGSVVSRQAALRAHEVLVGERLVLAAAVIAGGAGPAFALAVLIPVLVLSLTAQAVMRARHEIPPAPALLRRKDTVA